MIILTELRAEKVNGQLSDAHTLEAVPILHGKHKGKFALPPRIMELPELDDDRRAVLESAPVDDMKPEDFQE